MARLQRKSLGNPEQVRRFPHGEVEIVTLDEFVVSHFTFQPGWRWSEAVKPVVQTPSCQLRHLGITLSGRLRVRVDDGAELLISPGDAYEIPPGHDAWVDGDEPWVSYEFASGRSYAVAPDDVEREIATLLFTDIVESTRGLERLGDQRWRELLFTHNELMRAEIDRYRGREVTTTGDGFVVVFDSPARAVRCARGMIHAAVAIDLAIRAGVHTGEVEFVAGNVRGLAVHIAARVMSLAGPGEVFVTGTTTDLAAGAGLTFEPAGVFELKGITGARQVFRLA